MLGHVMTEVKCIASFIDWKINLREVDRSWIKIGNKALGNTPLKPNFLLAIIIKIMDSFSPSLLKLNSNLFNDMLPKQFNHKLLFV